MTTQATFAAPSAEAGPVPKQGLRFLVRTAPQHALLVSADLIASGLDACPSPAHPKGYLKVVLPPSGPLDGVAAATQVLGSHPYIHRLWRLDYLWPGAMGQADFVTRCADGLVQRWSASWPAGLSRVPDHEIQVEATFRDRSYLGSQLASALQQRLAAMTALPSRPSTQALELAGEPAPARASSPGPEILSILLTPKAVLASFWQPGSHVGAASVPSAWRKTLAGTTFPSRASRKCVEALAHGIASGLWSGETSAPHKGKAWAQRARPLEGQTWLDIGASPGGVTRALLGLGAGVVAVDRARLADDLYAAPNLVFLQRDAARLDLDEIRQQMEIPAFHGLVCDMNGSVEAACATTISLVPLLNAAAAVIFTLKLADTKGWREALVLVQRSFRKAGLHVVGARHLEANRNELTIFAQPSSVTTEGPAAQPAPALFDSGPQYR